MSLLVDYSPSYSTVAVTILTGILSVIFVLIARYGLQQSLDYLFDVFNTNGIHVPRIQRGNTNRFANNTTTGDEGRTTSQASGGPVNDRYNQEIKFLCQEDDKSDTDNTISSYKDSRTRSIRVRKASEHRLTNDSGDDSSSIGDVSFLKPGRTDEDEENSEAASHAEIWYGTSVDFASIPYGDESVVKKSNDKADQQKSDEAKNDPEKDEHNDQEATGQQLFKKDKTKPHSRKGSRIDLNVRLLEDDSDFENEISEHQEKLPDVTNVSNVIVSVFPDTSISSDVDRLVLTPSPVECKELTPLEKSSDDIVNPEEQSNMLVEGSKAGDVLKVETCLESNEAVQTLAREEIDQEGDISNNSSSLDEMDSTCLQNCIDEVPSGEIIDAVGDKIIDVIKCGCRYKNLICSKFSITNKTSKTFNLKSKYKDSIVFNISKEAFRFTDLEVQFSLHNIVNNLHFHPKQIPMDHIVMQKYVIPLALSVPEKVTNVIELIISTKSSVHKRTTTNSNIRSNDIMKDASVFENITPKYVYLINDLLHFVFENNDKTTGAAINYKEVGNETKDSYFYQGLQKSQCKQYKGLPHILNCQKRKIRFPFVNEERRDNEHVTMNEIAHNRGGHNISNQEHLEENDDEYNPRSSRLGENNTRSRANDTSPRESPRTRVSNGYSPRISERNSVSSAGSRRLNERRESTDRVLERVSQTLLKPEMGEHEDDNRTFTVDSGRHGDEASEQSSNGATYDYSYDSSYEYDDTSGRRSGSTYATEIGELYNDRESDFTEEQTPRTERLSAMGRNATSKQSVGRNSVVKNNEDSMKSIRGSDGRASDDRQYAESRSSGSPQRDMSNMPNDIDQYRSNNGLNAAESSSSTHNIPRKLSFGRSPIEQRKSAMRKSNVEHKELGHMHRRIEAEPRGSGHNYRKSRTSNQESPQRGNDMGSRNAEYNDRSEEHSPPSRNERSRESRLNDQPHGSGRSQSNLQGSSSNVRHSGNRRHDSSPRVTIEERPSELGHSNIERQSSGAITPRKSALKKSKIELRQSDGGQGTEKIIYPSMYPPQFGDTKPRPSVRKKSVSENRVSESEKVDTANGTVIRASRKSTGRTSQQEPKKLKSPRNSTVVNENDTPDKNPKRKSGLLTQLRASVASAIGMGKKSHKNSDSKPGIESSKVPDSKRGSKSRSPANSPRGNESPKVSKTDRGTDAGKIAGGSKSPRSSQSPRGSASPSATKIAGGSNFPSTSKLAGGSESPRASRRSGGSESPRALKIPRGDESPRVKNIPRGRESPRVSHAQHGSESPNIRKSGGIKSKITRSTSMTDFLLKKKQGTKKQGESVNSADDYIRSPEEVIEIGESAAESVEGSSGLVDSGGRYDGPENIVDSSRQRLVDSGGQYDSPENIVDSSRQRLADSGVRDGDAKRQDKITQCVRTSASAAKRRSNDNYGNPIINGPRGGEKHTDYYHGRNSVQDNQTRKPRLSLNDKLSNSPSRSLGNDYDDGYDDDGDDDDDDEMFESGGQKNNFESNTRAYPFENNFVNNDQDYENRRSASASRTHLNRHSGPFENNAVDNNQAYEDRGRKRSASVSRVQLGRTSSCVEKECERSLSAGRSHLHRLSDRWDNGYEENDEGYDERERKRNKRSHTTFVNNEFEGNRGRISQMPRNSFSRTSLGTSQRRRKDSRGSSKQEGSPSGSLRSNGSNDRSVPRNNIRSSSQTDLVDNNRDNIEANVNEADGNGIEGDIPDQIILRSPDEPRSFRNSQNTDIRSSLDTDLSPASTQNSAVNGKTPVKKYRKVKKVKKAETESPPESLQQPPKESEFSQSPTRSLNGQEKSISKVGDELDGSKDEHSKNEDIGSARETANRPSWQSSNLSGYRQSQRGSVYNQKERKSEVSSIFVPNAIDGSKEERSISNSDDVDNSSEGTSRPSQQRWKSINEFRRSLRGSVYNQADRKSVGSGKPPNSIPNKIDDSSYEHSNSTASEETSRPQKQRRKPDEQNRPAQRQKHPVHATEESDQSKSEYSQRKIDGEETSRPQQQRRTPDEQNRPAQRQKHPVHATEESDHSKSEYSQRKIDDINNTSRKISQPKVEGSSHPQYGDSEKQRNSGHDTALELGRKFSSHRPGAIHNAKVSILVDGNELKRDKGNEEGDEQFRAAITGSVEEAIEKKLGVVLRDKSAVVVINVNFTEAPQEEESVPESSVIDDLSCGFTTEDRPCFPCRSFNQPARMSDDVRIVHPTSGKVVTPSGTQYMVSSTGVGLGSGPVIKWEDNSIREHSAECVPIEETTLSNDAEVRCIEEKNMMGYSGKCQSGLIGLGENEAKLGLNHHTIPSNTCCCFKVIECCNRLPVTFQTPPMNEKTCIIICPPSSEMCSPPKSFSCDKMSTPSRTIHCDEDIYKKLATNYERIQPEPQSPYSHWSPNSPTPCSNQPRKRNISPIGRDSQTRIGRNSMVDVREKNYHQAHSIADRLKPTAGSSIQLDKETGFVSIKPNRPPTKSDSDIGTVPDSSTPTRAICPCTYKRSEHCLKTSDSFTAGMEMRAKQPLTSALKLNGDIDVNLKNADNKTVSFSNIVDQRRISSRKSILNNMLQDQRQSNSVYGNENGNNISNCVHNRKHKCYRTRENINCYVTENMNQIILQNQFVDFSVVESGLDIVNNVDTKKDLSMKNGIAGVCKTKHGSSKSPDVFDIRQEPILNQPHCINRSAGNVRKAHNSEGLKIQRYLPRYSIKMKFKRNGELLKSKHCPSKKTKAFGFRSNFSPANYRYLSSAFVINVMNYMVFYALYQSSIIYLEYGFKVVSKDYG